MSGNLASFNFPPSRHDIFVYIPPNTHTHTREKRDSARVAVTERSALVAARVGCGMRLVVETNRETFSHKSSKREGPASRSLRG